MVAKSTFYAMQRDRILAPVEHLRMLGWDRPALRNLSPSQTRNLAGEGMGLPAVTLAATVAAHAVGLW